MLIAERNGLLVGSGGGTPTAADYVQDGLFRQVDAIENLGYGQHTDTPTAWRDLIQNDDWNIYGATYENGMFIKNDSNTLPIQVALPESKVNALRDSGATIEVVVVPTVSLSNTGCLTAVGFTGSLALLKNGADVGNLRLGGSTPGLFAVPNYTFSSSTPPTVFSVVTETTGTKIYINGGLVATTADYTSANIATSYASWNATVGILGSGRSQSETPQYSLPMTGLGCKEYRLYERPVTAAEIAYNYAIDKFRFNLP